jgi:hypothetical protein
MNKQEALAETIRRFTNLYDGCVRNGNTVMAVISYYEKLQANKPVSLGTGLGNIENRFLDCAIQDIEDDLFDY